MVTSTTNRFGKLNIKPQSVVCYTITTHLSVFDNILRKVMYEVLIRNEK